MRSSRRSKPCSGAIRQAGLSDKRSEARTSETAPSSSCFISAKSEASAAEGGSAAVSSVAFEQRDRLDIRRALRDGFERLAVISYRSRDPEGVDRIAEQQNLDAAGAETFELRACGERLQRRRR